MYNYCSNILSLSYFKQKQMPEGKLFCTEKRGFLWLYHSLWRQRQELLQLPLYLAQANRNRGEDSRIRQILLVAEQAGAMGRELLWQMRLRGSVSK